MACRDLLASARYFGSFFLCAELSFDMRQLSLIVRVLCRRACGRRADAGGGRRGPVGGAGGGAGAEPRAGAGRAAGPRAAAGAHARAPARGGAAAAPPPRRAASRPARQLRQALPRRYVRKQRPIKDYSSV